MLAELFVATVSLVSPPTKAELLADIEAIRTNIQAIAATTDFNSNEGDGKLTSCRQQVLFEKTGKIRIDKSQQILRNKQGADVNLGESLQAYNGTTSYSISHKARTAVMSNGRSEFTMPSSSPWLLLNMYQPSQERDATHIVPDLVWCLNYGPTRIRPELEEVNGRQCIVLDMPNVQDGDPLVTAWLDAEHDGLVMQWRLLGPDGSERIKYETETFDQVATGLWMAISGKKITHTNIGGPFVEQGTIAIHQPAGEDLQITLNPVLSPDSFTPTIPSGYSVTDQDGNFYKQR